MYSFLNPSLQNGIKQVPTPAAASALLLEPQNFRISEFMNPIRIRSNSDAGQRISLSKGDLIREHVPARSTFLIPLVAMLAFIFDIDGTLVDSNEPHVDSWDRAFRRFGKHFPREKLRAQIGKGSDQYLPEFLTPDEIDHFGKELDDYRSDLFRNEYLPKVRPFPKVRELFQRIRDENKRIVLASSGKKADTKYYIDLLKIDDLIEGYTSGDDADNSKPAPDIFAASLKKLGNISSADAVTVGDTRFDIEAARKAGLTTIAFLCGGTSESVLREAGAVAIYRDPADFLVHYDELIKEFIPESPHSPI
jgi:HAD superfamily hydrolase (TIGR01509 family)